MKKAFLLSILFLLFSCTKLDNNINFIINGNKYDISNSKISISHNSKQVNIVVWINDKIENIDSSCYQVVKSNNYYILYRVYYVNNSINYTKVYTFSGDITIDNNILNGKLIGHNSDLIEFNNYHL